MLPNDNFSRVTAERARQPQKACSHRQEDPSCQACAPAIRLFWTYFGSHSFWKQDPCLLASSFSGILAGAAVQRPRRRRVLCAAPSPGTPRLSGVYLPRRMTPLFQAHPREFLSIVKGKGRTASACLLQPKTWRQGEEGDRRSVEGKRNGILRFLFAESLANKPKVRVLKSLMEMPPRMSSLIKDVWGLLSFELDAL